MGSPSSEDVEKSAEDSSSKKETPVREKEKSSGMSQSSKDDLGVFLAIGLIVALAFVAVVIKIIIYDRTKYPHLFGGGVSEEDAQVAAESEEIADNAL